MKLKQWALVAEVFSALAVLVTLIILLIEVRTGNELARIASFQDILTRLNEQRTLVISNPELANLLYKSQSDGYPEWGTLEADKLRQFHTNDFNTFNIAWFSYQAGVISEVEWVRLTRAICRVSNALPTEYKEEIYFRLTDDVVNYIVSAC